MMNGGNDMNMQYRTRPRTDKLCYVTVEQKDGYRKQYFDISEICGLDWDDECRWLELYRRSAVRDVQEMVGMIDTFAVKRWYWEDY